MQHPLNISGGVAWTSGLSRRQSGGWGRPQHKTGRRCSGRDPLATCADGRPALPLDKRLHRGGIGCRGAPDHSPDSRSSERSSRTARGSVCRPPPHCGFTDRVTRWEGSVHERKVSKKAVGRVTGGRERRLVLPNRRRWQFGMAGRRLGHHAGPATNHRVLAVQQVPALPLDGGGQAQDLVAD